jgi:biopolymer transport protein ExbD
MEQFKNIKFVLLILFVVLILVIVRTSGKNHFRQGAQNAVETVASKNFSISETEFKTTEKDYLVVDLNESGKIQFENSLKISFEKLLEESSLQKFKETENKILLFSGDDSKAEKAWVILNQLGFKNVYVLSTEENTEVLKYEFQRDTLAGLESYAK